MTTDSPRQRVQAYLAAHHVMTLATGGDEGPWAAAVFYVHEGGVLHFLSAPREQALPQHRAKPARVGDDP